MGTPWPEPLTRTPEEQRELSRLAIQYALAWEELCFAEELERLLEPNHQSQRQDGIDRDGLDVFLDVPPLLLQVRQKYGV